MQPVGIPGAAKQAEDHVIGVDEGRDIAGEDHGTEQGGIAPGAQSDDVHDVSSQFESLLSLERFPAKWGPGSRQENASNHNSRASFRFDRNEALEFSKCLEQGIVEHAGVLDLRN